MNKVITWNSTSKHNHESKRQAI